MRITISKTGKPLSHLLWFFIYLFCIFFGLAGQVKCEDTIIVHRPDRVTRQWKLLDLEFWRVFYGTKTREAQKHTGTSVPDAEQASYPAEVERWRQRTREHHPSPRRTPRVLASALWRQNHRRGHNAADPHTPYQGALHKASSRILHYRGDVWS